MVVLSMLTSYSASAQFLGGFFNQKGTQRRYMIQQIALYQIYLGYLKKGYTITKDGLHTISDIRSGELSLHKDYYAGLSAINPAVAKMPEIRAVMDNSRLAISCVDETIAEAAGAQIFSLPEVKYMDHTREILKKRIVTTLGMLELAIKPGVMMTDDERIQRVLQAHEQSLKQYVFARKFSEDLVRQTKQRKLLQTEVYKGGELQ